MIILSSIIYIQGILLLETGSSQPPSTHLRQFLLDNGRFQLYELYAVADLDTREGLDQSTEVLLEQRVVEDGEMGIYDGISSQLLLVLLQRHLQQSHLSVAVIGTGDSHIELPERAFLVSVRHSFHRIDFQSNVLESSLGVNNRRDVCCIVGHDLAEQHVLQFEHRLGIVQRTALLERFVEVRVGCLVVMLFGVKQSRFTVDLASRCETRWHLNGRRKAPTSACKVGGM